VHVGFFEGAAVGVSAGAAALAAATVLALVPSTASAAGVQPFHAMVRDPLAGLVVNNPCTGEDVTITSGVLQTVLTEFADPGDGQHLIITQPFQNMVGVGESGVAYRFSEHATVASLVDV
jgi:hypothetical protein